MSTRLSTAPAVFVCGHATHPDWRGALTLAGLQIDAQLQAQAGAAQPTLGLAYFTEAYAPQAPALLAALQQRWPGVAWAGCAGVGVAASGVEYFDEPGLVLLLAALPTGQFQVFHGGRPLRAGPATHSALVHVDAGVPELPELLQDLAGRTTTGYLFGGLVASRTGAWHLADGAWQGGLSGVAFGPEVGVLSRVTQGCQPVGPVRRITACERNIVTQLDGEPALPLLLKDLGLNSLDDPRQALPLLRATLVGLSDERHSERSTAQHRAGQFGTEVRVRHLLGLDPGRQAVAVGELLAPGMRLAFCQRHVEAARRDLVRVCAELREALDGDSGDSGEAKPPRRILGALYVSCTGRGGPHFGGPSAELRLIEHALSATGQAVPLAGFFAGGEIAGQQLYGYTGVLTLFTAPA
jgi:small ligand-binding sensory domain FIST